jgi:hypothetical protein
MFKYKCLDRRDDGAVGISLIFLWLFSFTLSYNIVRGDHTTLGVGVGPFEVNLGLSIWRKLLP